MSGHSKWHNIQRKKNLVDAKRGAIFTKHAHLISIAAISGGDIEMNPSLKAAVESAKLDNVPNANIERAIKKGTGELKDGTEISEILYEGYGPAGVAIMVEAITDNKNRTVSNLKTIFNKQGGSLGGSGAVSFLFARKGLILTPIEGNREDLEMKIIEAGAEDMKEEGGLMEIYTAPNNLYQVKKTLEEKGVKIEKAQLSYIPKNTVQITDAEQARKILNLVSALEDDEDVNNVFSNFEMEEELMRKASED